MSLISKVRKLKLIKYLVCYCLLALIIPTANVTIQTDSVETNLSHNEPTIISSNTNSEQSSTINNSSEELVLKEEELTVEEVTSIETTSHIESNQGTNIPLDSNLINYIINKCKENNIDNGIVFSVIFCESSFNPNAYNKNSNCRGLMQLSQRYYGTDCNLFDPYVNVNKGISMLANYYHTYKDYNKALMCYSMGCGGAKSKFNKGIYSSSYSRKVINLSNKYRMD